MFLTRSPLTAPPSRELSTADLALAAERSASATTTDLKRKAPTAAEHTPRPLTRAHAPRTSGQLRNQWTDIQAAFVDEPRRAVERADGLVADAIKRLAETFSNERAQLEGQWGRGGDVSTEDLRQSLQRYRSFFSRLLSV